MYRGTLRPASLIDFSVYVAFFPYLAAGPFARASEFLPQLRGPRDPRHVDTSRAFFLIFGGLVKKMLIADHLATHIVNAVFTTPGQYSLLSNRTRLIKPQLDDRLSTGLVRPDFFNWPAQLQSQVEAFDPGAVAVMFGANDNQPLQTSSGKIHQFGSDGWKNECRRRVEDAIALLYQGGVRRVYWIGQPVMPGSTFNGQVRLMNDIYRGVAEKTFGVRYIDAYKLLSNGSGQYAQYLRDADGTRQRVREQDGEHLTYAGGLRVAEAVMAAIEEEWFAEGAGAGAPSPKASVKASPAP